ncbi:MAG: hypothetical protein H6713_42960 [Myxococcales bacterium]|nr:hypothetical protein [Myxococcales bacterium]
MASAVGAGHTCALGDKGGVRCWGAGDAMFALGQLGNESLEGIGDQPGELSTPPVKIGGVAIELAEPGYRARPSGPAARGLGSPIRTGLRVREVRTR